MKTLSGFLFLTVALSLGCSEYSKKEWSGWIDFYAEASFKLATCGQTSLEYAAHRLGTDDSQSIRSMYVAWGLWPEMQQRVACMDKAKDCEQIRRCYVQDAQLCDRDTYQESCEGDTAVSCAYIELQGDWVSFVKSFNCASVPGGGRCEVNGRYADCVYNQCEHDADNARCEGDVSLFCEDREESFIYWMMDCSVLDMQCMPTGGCGFPEAIYCEGDMYDQACDGPYTHKCTPSGPFSRDCRETHPDFVCFDDRGQDRCGMPEGQWECEENEVLWCEGQVLKACIYGKLISFDCSSFADSVCDNGECVLPQ